MCVCAPCCMGWPSHAPAIEMTVVHTHWPSWGWLSMEVVQGSLSLLLNTVSHTLLPMGQLEPVAL